MEYSRFSNTELTIVDGHETYGTWNQFDFLVNRPPEDQIGTFQVTNAVEGRPDLISTQLYGTPALFWVLIAFNNARIALNWPRAGDVIEFPIESLVIPQILQ